MDKHGIFSPLELIEVSGGDILSVVRQDVHDNPDTSKDIRRRIASANSSFSLTLLIASQEVAQNGTTPQDSYLQGATDVIAYFIKLAQGTEDDARHTLEAEPSRIITPEAA